MTGTLRLTRPALTFVACVCPVAAGCDHTTPDPTRDRWTPVPAGWVCEMCAAYHNTENDL